MLRIRLSRGGKKRQPHYRVVVANVDAKRDGRVVERIGHYDPLTDPLQYRIEEERALYWLSVGAQPTDAVQRLLVKQGTINRLERLRAGESLESLVAEFEGRTLEPEVEAVVEAIVAEAIVAEEIVAEEIIDELIDELIEDEVEAVLLEEVEDMVEAESDAVESNDSEAEEA